MERWEQMWSDHIMSKNPDPFIPRLICIAFNSVPPHTNLQLCSNIHQQTGNITLNPLETAVIFPQNNWLYIHSAYLQVL